MLNCKMGWHQVLGFLCFVSSLHSSLLFASPPCLPDQRDALLQLKEFVLNNEASDFTCDYYTDVTLSHLPTRTWSKSLDCCMWDGIECDDITGDVLSLHLPCTGFRDDLYSTNSSLLLPKLEILDLSYCNLTKFPYFLNSLKGLTTLDLSWNKISGEIPKWFWGISHATLESLDLSHNLLEGGIQQLQWKRLLDIHLHDNSFQGPLPSFPPSTLSIVADDNNFTGEIPSSICQLRSLHTLGLLNNNLCGNMPLCLGNLTNLAILDLSFNKLQGPLPRSLAKCTTLSQLFLNQNEFNDIFPHWLEAPSLDTLDLRSNKFYGRINITAFALSFPANPYLSVSDNNFNGWWPSGDFSNTSIRVLDLSNNGFGGPIPLVSPSTKSYSIASNNFIGKIPSWICNASTIQMIDFSSNGFTGFLPRCLLNSSFFLSILNLRMNYLEGTIPQSSAWSPLATLNLSQNRFKGTLPQSLANCKFLEVLDLGDNQLEDTFPRWLGTLPGLRVLVLRFNNLKGHINIPRRGHLFPELRILDLSNNKFGGHLPANLIMNLKGMINGETGEGDLYMTRYSLEQPYQNSVTVVMKGLEIELVKILTIFKTIDLSHNSFQGEIPEAIGHLHFLIGLNLSHNHLTGSIPLTLGNLTKLGWLDLSSNKLSGVIPRVLGDLTSLGYLNLSKNKFFGRIPQDRQLSTFSSKSFSENPGLCGTPLLKACPGDAQPPPPFSSPTFDRDGHESWFKQKVVWIGYASGLVIGISIAYIAFATGWPKWLARGVRILERKAAEWMEKPERRAIKFHGQ